MNKDKLLEEARLRYPVGTKFNSTGGTKNCIIDKEYVFKYISDEGSIGILIDGDLEWRVYNGNNEWAEILSSPKPKLLDNYKIY